MKVLQMIFFYLKLFGFCSDVREPTNDFLKSPMGIWVLIIHLGPILSFNAVYVYINLTDLDSIASALVVLIAGIISFAGFISMGIQMKSVKALYAEIQAIVDRTEKTFAFDLYIQAERESSFFTKWTMIILTWMYITVLYIGCTIYACYNMFMGNWDSTTYFLPEKMWFPFVDNNTIIGFFVLLLIQAFSYYIHTSAILVSFLYFINCCMFIIASCKEFERQFNDINELINADDYANRMMDIKARLVEATTLHIRIIKFVYTQLLYFEFELMCAFTDCSISEMLSNQCTGTIFFLLNAGVAFFAIALFRFERVVFNSRFLNQFILILTKLNFLNRIDSFNFR